MRVQRIAALQQRLERRAVTRAGDHVNIARIRPGQGRQAVLDDQHRPVMALRNVKVLPTSDVEVKFPAFAKKADFQHLTTTDAQHAASLGLQIGQLQGQSGRQSRCGVLQPFPKSPS